MSCSLARVALAGVLACFAATFSYAQTQTTSSTTKSFEVIAVEQNDLVVKLPEGTRRITVPDDFKFTVDGQALSVRDLKPGMRGTATITSRTTVTPVTVTEVKNGTVVMSSSYTIYVRTPEGTKQFTQNDVDKRAVSIVRDGKPAKVSDFKAGDTISATIVTSQPPRVLTEQEVHATLDKAPRP